MMLLPRQKSFLDLFPTPEFLLLSTAGIALSDTDTKFVQLRKEILGDGFKLLHSKKIDNPQGAVEFGNINRAEEISNMLKNLSSKYNIHHVHCVLPEEKAYIFTTKIGWVPPQGLRDAVAFIIEGNAPVSLGESIFDFEIISDDKSAGEINVAVCVLPESVVKSYIDLFESAGITPISFDTESQAIARAVVGRGDRRSHLIINICENKTGFYVVDEEVVQFSTTLAYGLGKDHSYPNLNDLRTEMSKVITFWDSRTNTQRIEKLILCGPGANHKDFVGKLMSESEIEYVLADVWLNMSPSRGHAPEMFFGESLSYAAAVGLVLPHNR